MALVVADLASAINTALGPPTDKDGNPIAVTSEMMGYANAVVTTLKAGTFTHAVGTVLGVGAPGAPITGGTALLGIIAGVSAGTWSGILASAFPGATTTATEAGASTGYIMASGKVNFASGDITGTCTATPLSPGILAAGAGSGGLVAALVGSAWASAVLAAIGSPGPLAAPVYTAVANYIIANAACSYATGTVVGVFAATGGPMTAGAGTAGLIA